MADSFFGFDTSSANLNQHDDEGGGFEPSEDEYDALNDETFGGGDGEFDWEEQHEEYSAIAEKSKKIKKHNDFDLESRLSHLDLGSNAALSSATNSVFAPISSGTFSIQPQLPPAQNHTLTSSIWGQPDASLLNGFSRTYTQSVPPTLNLKNVCTVEEIERNLLQQQQPAQSRQALHNNQVPNQGINVHNQGINQVPNTSHGPIPVGPPPGLQHFQSGPPQQPRNFFQPRFPPVILQRPQALPQQTQTHVQSQHVYNTRQPPPSMHHQMGGPLSNHMGQQPPVNQMGIRPPGMVPQTQGPIGQIGPQQPIGASQPNVIAAPQIMSQPQVLIGQTTLQMVNNQVQAAQMMKQFSGPMVNHQNQILPQNHPRNQPPIQGQFNHQQQFRPIINANNHPMQPFQLQMAPPPLGQHNTAQHFSPQQQKPLSKPSSKEQTKMPPNQNQFANKPNAATTSQSLVQHIQNTHPMLNPFHHLMGNSYHNASHHPLINRGGFFNGQPNMTHQMMFAQNNQRFNGVAPRNGHSDMPHRDRHDSLQDDQMFSRAGGDCNDEYAGLMTPREKQWLINIQLMQLNTGTPYMDDYYYTVFLDRKSKKKDKESSEAHKANQQNHPFYSGGKQDKEKDKNAGGRERHNSGRGGEEGERRTYVPLQFENSLGKLQCGSVTAPRKIIDVEVVGTESESSPPVVASSMATPLNSSIAIAIPKRHKQLLLDIEALYCLLLRLEEMGEPLAIANALVLKDREEKQKAAAILEQQLAMGNDDDSPISPSSPLSTKQWTDASDALLRNIESVQQKHKTQNEQQQKKQAVSVLPVQNQLSNLVQKNLLDEDKEELLTRIFAVLMHEDKLTAILSVRKGKMLLIRLVNRAPAPGLPGCPVSGWRELWCRILRALPFVSRRDARDEDTLPQLLPSFKSHLNLSAGWELLADFCRTVEETFKESSSSSSGRLSVTRSVTPTLNRCPMHMSIASRLMISILVVMIEKADSLLRSCPDPDRCKLWASFLTGLTATLRSFHGSIVAKPIEPLSSSFVRSHVAFVWPHVAAAAGKVSDIGAEIACDVLNKFLC